MMEDCAKSASEKCVQRESWSITAESGWLVLSSARVRGTTVELLIAGKRQDDVQNVTSEGGRSCLCVCVCVKKKVQIAYAFNAS